MTETTLIEMRFGSHLYGTATPQSDVDFKAVHVPAGRALLLQRAEKVISRKTKQDGTAKNTADDVDYESYSVQKYLALAAEGQTVALDMLFAPEWSWTSEASPLWLEIRANKDRLLTSQYTSFVGYCRTQANKYGIKGSRMAAARAIVEFLGNHYTEDHGGIAKVYDIEESLTAFVAGKEHMAIVKIAQHGVDADKPPMKHIEVCNRKMPFHASIKRTYETYKGLFNEYGQRARQAEVNSGVDWKALSHAVRIGRQAIEVLKTGNVIFPRVDAEHLLAVKTGKLEYKAVAAEIEELLAQIEIEAARSPLRNEPDWAWIESFVEKVHREAVCNI